MATYPQKPKLRSYPKPHKEGTISFTFDKTGLRGETHYYLWGSLDDSQKTPLVCLHGGPGIPHQYILPTCLVHVDHGIPVLMYDQIGCGESTRFPDKKGDESFWPVELFMSELDNVIEHFGIKEFDLYGQSWGAMLAGQYALERQPTGLRKLIVEGGPTDIPVYDKIAKRLRSQLPEDVQEVLDRCEREGKMESEEYEKATMVYYGRHICRIDPFPDELMESFEAVGKDNTVYFTMLGANEFNCTGSLKDWSITDQLHKITEKTVPGGMLVMNGFYDSVQDENTAPFFYNVSCKVKWVRFAESSHMPFFEEQEKFFEALGTFLTQG